MNQRSGQVPRIVAVKAIFQRFAYMGLAVLAFALMLLGKADTVLVERIRTTVTDAVNPIVEVLAKPVSTVARVVAEVRELADLRAANAVLREQNSRLMAWQTVARHLEAENESLQRLLNFTPQNAISMVTARVVQDNGGAFAHSLVMNAGSRDGARKGQAVMADEGLVGRIHDVGLRSARVLLITDLNSRIPVLVESTRTRAIMAGDNSDQPRLIQLPPGAVVSAGDRIVTSGHGGAFPPGLPVGRVAAVTDGVIKVVPFVSRYRLEYVRAIDYGLDGILDLSRPPADSSGPKP